MIRSGNHVGRKNQIIFSLGGDRVKSINIGGAMEILSAKAGYRYDTEE